MPFTLHFSLRSCKILLTLVSKFFSYCHSHSYIHKCLEPDHRDQSDSFVLVSNRVSPRPQSPVLLDPTFTDISFSEEQLSCHTSHSRAFSNDPNSGNFSSSVQIFMRNSRIFGREGAASQGLSSQTRFSSKRSSAAWVFPDCQKRHTYSNFVNTNTILHQVYLLSVLQRSTLLMLNLITKQPCKGPK